MKTYDPKMWHLLNKDEKINILMIKKLYTWEKGYANTVSWDDFKDSYFQCTKCGTWHSRNTCLYHLWLGDDK